MKMFPSIIKKYFKPKKNNSKHKNLIEATRSSFFVKRLFGITVIEYKSEAGIIKSVVNYFGLLCFLFWYTLFIFCVYVAYNEDQSVLRMLFDTKLKQYGDNYERVATILIVVYAMWKLPFSLNSNTDYVRFNAVLDEVIRNIGVTVDYHKQACIALVTSLMQVVVFIARVMSIWVTIRNLNEPVPHERILQVVYSDVLSLILSGHYCYYLSVLKARYGIINDVLSEIKLQQKKKIAFEYTMFVGDGKNYSLNKDKYICEKIKKCARVYSMLFQATGRVSKIFGVGLVIVMSVGLNNIILYMFYFMEATASPLFHDLERYAYFLAYVFWQILYALGVIYIIVYFSETTLSEAKNAAYITHEIMNCDTSPSVTAEAMQLSLQLLHETPTFTACGLFHLDYSLMQQGTRTVVTFLVILLQFVMNA